MNRREFLSFTTDAQTMDVSCEKLYMQYLDALQQGHEKRFLDRKFEEFACARRLRLRESFWLKSQALRQAIEPRLERYKAQGGTVELG